MEFTSGAAALAAADVFVMTVLTSIESARRLDLSPLRKASGTVGRALKARGSAGATGTTLVIYESTV